MSAIPTGAPVIRTNNRLQPRQHRIASAAENGSFAAMAQRQPQNPLALSVKAARLGAVALLVGLVILGWPVAQGYRDAQAGAPKPALGDGWQELRRFGWEIGAGGTG